VLSFGFVGHNGLSSLRRKGESAKEKRAISNVFGRAFTERNYTKCIIIMQPHFGAIAPKSAPSKPADELPIARRVLRGVSGRFRGLNFDKFAPEKKNEPTFFILVAT